MGKLLAVVDMQHDFVDGSLGTPEAREIVPCVAHKIRNWYGNVVYTMDTHPRNYLETQEGRYLPVRHCIEGTKGHQLVEAVSDAISAHGSAKQIIKNTFGATNLIKYLTGTIALYDSIEFVGLCTDICVVSNALLVKAFFPEVHLVVDASCCAGVTPETHLAALQTMKMCQIDIIGEE